MTVLWSVRVGSVRVGSVLVGEGVLGWGRSSHFWWSKGSAVTIDLFPAGGGTAKIELSHGRGGVGAGGMPKWSLLGEWEGAVPKTAL